MNERIEEIVRILDNPLYENLTDDEKRELAKNWIDEANGGPIEIPLQKESQ